MEPIGITEAATSAGKPQVTVKRSLLLIGDISLFAQRFGPDLLPISAVFRPYRLKHAFPRHAEVSPSRVAGTATDERSDAPIRVGIAFP